MRLAFVLLILLAGWGASARAETAAPTSERLAPLGAPHDLCCAALGVEVDLDPATRAQAEVRWRELLARWHEAWIAARSPREDAERLLSFLHDEALRGRYRADASRVSETLLHGDYNCLSATLLFTALAESVELPVAGTLWLAHVACVVNAGGPAIDVEPTCRDWFQVTDPAARAELRRRAFAAQGASFDLPPTRIEGRQMAALVGYNQGSERLRSGQTAAAIESLERAYALDPASPAIRGNLLAALNNEAVKLQRQGASASARGLLERCRQIAPGDALTAENLARLGR